MTRTAGAPIGCQRPSRFWGLGCPKIYHEAEDTLVRQCTDRTGWCGQQPDGALWRRQRQRKHLPQGHALFLSQYR
ncbi:hypothetical protein, partial [Thiolapillus sp.]|uniref:hypothetical protein n=1 Tax=Thiolapillus sp. TaxID=2017437 RepID=UPI003AF459C0